MGTVVSAPGWRRSLRLRLLLPVALAVGVITATLEVPGAHAVLIRQSLAVGAGTSVPLGPTSFPDLWNAGLSLSGSVRFRLMPRIHANLEVTYHRHLSDSAALSALVRQQFPNVSVSGHDLWVLPVSLVGEFDLIGRGSTKPYGILGVGIYKIGVTAATVSGPGADQVELDDPSDTVAGLQIGVGIRTPISLGVTLSLDGTVHVANTGGEATRFLPLRIGLQF